MYYDLEDEAPKLSEETSSKLSKDIDDLKYHISIIDDKVCTLLELNEVMQVSLKDVLSFTETSKVPLWLVRFIRDSHKCRICLSTPIKPPVIMSKCCKNILGCEE